MAVEHVAHEVCENTEMAEVNQKTVEQVGNEQIPYKAAELPSDEAYSTVSRLSLTDLFPLKKKKSSRY